MSSPTLLHQLVVDRKITQAEARELLRQRARALEIPDRDFDLSQRQFARLIAGDVKTAPRPVVCRVIEAEFGFTVAALLTKGIAPSGMAAETPAGPGHPRELGALNLAADASADFALWQPVDEITALTLLARLSALTNSYVNAEMLPVVAQIQRLRADSVALLHRGGAHTGLLYGVAGLCSAILAHASGNLGFLHHSPSHVNAALRFADLGSHPSLAAWAMGVAAMQQEWSGDPARAIGTVSAATHRLPTQLGSAGSTPVWLAAIAARAQARLGNSTGTRASLDLVSRRREMLASAHSPDELDMDAIGGIVSFGLPKQHYYAATALRRIGDYASSRRHALMAIEGYVTGPAEQRSYGDETLARLDLAIAFTLDERPDLDGASDGLNHVASLPTSMLLPTLISHLKELVDAASTPHLRSASKAKQIVDSARAIAATCREPQRRAIA